MTKEIKALYLANTYKVTELFHLYMITLDDKQCEAYIEAIEAQKTSKTKYTKYKAEQTDGDL
jgi:hypothetical protein